MKKEKKCTFATTGYSIELNVMEMKTIADLCCDVDYVLTSHKKSEQAKGMKKSYLNDAQLMRILAVLKKLSEDTTSEVKNDFEEETKKIEDWYKSNDVEPLDERSTIPSLFPEQENDDIEADNE